MTEPSHTITALIIHKLVKERHGPVGIELGAEPCALGDSAVRLVERLCLHYAERPGKGYGRFEDDDLDCPVPRLIREHVVEHAIDFTTLSQQMMQHLQTCAELEELATGGFVLIARTHDFGADCLWIALLTEAIGSTINERLEVVDSAHLDFARLRVAGRIDLTGWQQGAERYISFLKGRGEVASYFKQFVGCTDVVIALKETQKLVHTLGRFADAQKLAPTARDELMERAHVYLDDLGESLAPLNLERVAQQVWPSEPERLHDTLHEAATELSSGFVPDRRALRPLIRFRASAQQWKVEFDRSSLRTGAVHYDKATDTLVLSDIPDHLRQMLLEE